MASHSFSCTLQEAPQELARVCHFGRIGNAYDHIALTLEVLECFRAGVEARHILGHAHVKAAINVQLPVWYHSEAGHQGRLSWHRHASGFCE